MSKVTEIVWQIALIKAHGFAKSATLYMLESLKALNPGIKIHHLGLHLTSEHFGTYFS